MMTCFNLIHDSCCNRQTAWPRSSMVWLLVVNPAHKLESSDHADDKDNHNFDDKTWFWRLTTLTTTLSQWPLKKRGDNPVVNPVHKLEDSDHADDEDNHNPDDKTWFLWLTTLTTTLSQQPLTSGDNPASKTVTSWLTWQGRRQLVHSSPAAKDYVFG